MAVHEGDLLSYDMIGDRNGLLGIARIVLNAKDNFSAVHAAVSVDVFRGQYWPPVGHEERGDRACFGCWDFSRAGGHLVCSDDLAPSFGRRELQRRYPAARALVADCPTRGPVSVYDMRKAVFEGIGSCAPSALRDTVEVPRGP
jgi:hypothetical protein